MPENIPTGGSGEFDPTGEIKVDTLGRYKILSELGRGGCGVVYRALDPSIGRVVAIKTILAAESMGKEARERFRREARSAGNLYHPNIVTVHDFEDSGNSMYIAMEFVEGRTLAEIMSGGPVPVETTLTMLRAAADALDYAHSHQIVHRDIKPANFMISTTGRLKITDFGIAKALDKDEGLTSTGVLVGTAQYMSPEQISEMPVTGRSDQFSLAVIAYELLTGVRPFQGNSWASVIHAIIMAEPAPVSRYRANLGEAVNEVLRRALAKDPEKRYGSCLEFCGALEQAIHNTPEERTAILPNPMRTLSVSAPQETRTSVPLSARVPAPETAATRKHAVPSEPTRVFAPPAKKSSSLMPLLIGAAAGMVIAGALWFGLRHKASAPETTAAPQQSTPAHAPTAAASGESPKLEVPVSAPQTTAGSKKTTAAAPDKEAARKKRETSVVVPPAPVEVAKSAPPPASQPASQSAPQPVQPPTQPAQSPQPVASNPPQATPTVQSAPPVPDDTAKRLAEKRAADEQTKRLADEQAKRDEQTKLAAAEQARRTAEEQAKNARTAADLSAITRALASYRSAYDRRDAAALESIWPTIPKQVFEEIRRSFRDASEVRMELHPVGDPKISGNNATVLCDRNLRQVIMKQALQASSKVQIVLVRAGTGWAIQSVEAVN